MKFAEKFLNIFGWKLLNGIGEIPPKAIMIGAGHTSNFDFLWSSVAYKALGVKAHFLIKKEAFFFPLAGLLRKAGGIPVDRKRKSNIVQDVVNEFNNREKFILSIAPEGTRKPVKTWKEGYHRIAKGANVPILIGVFNYKTKEVGVMRAYHLQGDAKFDTLEIMKIYKDVGAKYPENFYLPPEAYK